MQTMMKVSRQNVRFGVAKACSSSSPMVHRRFVRSTGGAVVMARAVPPPSPSGSSSGTSEPVKPKKFFDFIDITSGFEEDELDFDEVTSSTDSVDGGAAASFFGPTSNEARRSRVKALLAMRKVLVNVRRKVEVARVEHVSALGKTLNVFAEGEAEVANLISQLPGLLRACWDDNTGIPPVPTTSSSSSTTPASKSSSPSPSSPSNEAPSPPPASISSTAPPSSD